ncbi:hypothetical protein D3C72_1232210 [compost metagenome]
MQVTADTGGRFGVATESPHLMLKLRSGSAALASTLQEVGFQPGIFHVLGRGVETLFTILAEFDQFVEDRNDVFVWAGHDTTPLHEERCKEMEQCSCQIQTNNYLVKFQ